MKKYLFSISTVALIAMLAFGVLAQQGELNKVPHGINPNSKSPNFPGFALTTGSTRKAPALFDRGGPLINTPTVYIIWYGNWNQANGKRGDTAQGQALIRRWAGDIGGSPYYQLNTSLSVSPTRSISGNVAFTAGTNETTASGSTSLSDTDIQNVVTDAISSHRLPNDPSGVYFVITSSDVTASSGFCTQYCGWHTSATTTVGKVRYSFVGNAARCYSACAAQSNSSPNGLPGIDAAISVLSHELEEANTDPDINAWLARNGAENADECAWTFGHAQIQISGSSNPDVNLSWYNQNINGDLYLIQRNILKTGGSFYCMVNSVQN